MQIGDSPCVADPEPTPRVEFDVIRSVNESGPPSTYELGVLFSICFSGFDEAQAIDAVVFLPNGTRRSKRLAPSDSGFLPRPWEFFTFPPDPLGAYQVLATQGSVRAVATFTIVAPMRPKLEVLRYTIRAGSSLPVALSGFAPRERVELHLYRATGYTQSQDGPQRVYTRRGRVASFRVDAQGFARRSVVVRRPGAYQLAAGALFNTGFGFEVLRRR